MQALLQLEIAIMNYHHEMAGMELSAEVPNDPRPRAHHDPFLKLWTIPAATDLCAGSETAATERFLTRLGCSIKDGLLICEFLLPKMMTL